MSFTVATPTTGGVLVIESDDPKLDAYKYAAMLKQRQGREYQLRIDDGDGSYTVLSDGLAPMKFTPTT